MSVLDIAASVALSEQFIFCRETAVAVMGEEKFMDKVDGFRPILIEICEKNNISKMEATISILEMLKGREIESMLAMAACAEIIEPSLGL